MRTTPKTENEIAEAGLWPAGEVDFEIIEAVEKISKSGNEMIELKLSIFNAEGQHRTVRDYLLDAIAYKVRHCAAACGLLPDYESGMLHEGDLIGKTGRLKLGVKPAQDGYQPQNTVRDYVVPPADGAPTARARSPLNGHPTPARASVPSDPFGSDIPF